MLTNIQSLFADILQTPQQRALQLTNEGLARAELATRGLSGGAAMLSPLIASEARTAPMREEMLSRSLGRLFGQDVRTESESIQNTLSQADTSTPEGQQALITALRNQGYGAQAAQLQQQMAEQAIALEDRAVNQQLQQGELGLQQQRMLLAEQEQRSREEQLRLQALRDERQFQVQGFEVANQSQQVEIARMNAELRAEEIAIQRERNMALGRQETDQTRRFIMEATNEAIEQRANATSLLAVAQQFENVQPRAGVFGSSAAAFREFLGTQGGEDAVKQQYLRLRNSDVINSLPPGAASDRDITIFMGGWPPENANANYIAEFVRAQAKIATVAAEMNAAKAKYISDNNGNIAGFYDYWQAISSEPEFLDSVQEKYGVSFAAEDEAALRQSLLESMSLNQGRRTNVNR